MRAVLFSHKPPPPPPPPHLVYIKSVVVVNLQCHAIKQKFKRVIAAPLRFSLATRKAKTMTHISINHLLPSRSHEAMANKKTNFQRLQCYAIRVNVADQTVE